MTVIRQSRGIKAGWYVYWQSSYWHIAECEGGDMLIENLNNRSDSHSVSLYELLHPNLDEEYDDSIDTEVLFAATEDELYKLVASTSPATEPVNIEALPDSFVSEAMRIVQTVEIVENIIRDAKIRAYSRGKAKDFRKGSVLNYALRQLDPEMRIGKTQYYEYCQKYERYGGDIGRIAASKRRNTYGKTKFDTATLHLVDTFIMHHYVRSKAITKTSVYVKMCKLLVRTQGRWIDPEKCKGHIPDGLIEDLFDKNIPIDIILNNEQNTLVMMKVEIPSKSWFLNYIKWYENHPERGEAVIKSRYGKNHWENYYQVFDSFVHKAQYPLHYVMVDHWLIDIFVVDAEHRKKKFRMWLTALIDVRTRAILGFALLPEHPCIESIQTALLNSIWPKNPLLEMGINAVWIARGIPQNLSMDNAWAHMSHSLEALARDISQKGKYNAITLIWRPPYKARYGAVIERFFGNLSVKLKAAFSEAGAILSIDKKDIGRAKDLATLLPEDIHKFIYQEIVKYMHTPHGGLNGMTPHERWVADIEEIGEPIIPPLTGRMRRYFHRLMPTPKKLSTNHGISCFGMSYWAPELASAERYDQHGKKVDYFVRYDPEDISRISLYRDDIFIGELKSKVLLNADGSTQKVSEAARKLAQLRAKAKGKRAQDWLEEIDGIDDQDDLDELIQLRKREKRNKKRKLNSKSKTPTDTDISNIEKRLSDDIDNSDFDDLIMSFIDG